jgi:hypothetical protein
VQGIGMKVIEKRKVTRALQKLGKRKKAPQL